MLKDKSDEQKPLLNKKENLSKPAIEIAEKERSYLSHIFEHAGHYKAGIAFNTLNSFIIAGANVIGPFLLSKMIERIQNDEVEDDSPLKDVPTLGLLIGAATSFLLAKTLHSVKVHLSTKHSNAISQEIAQKIVENVIKLDYSDYRKIKPGELEEIIPSTRRGIEKFIGNSFFFIPLVFELTIANILLFVKNNNWQYGAAFSSSIVASSFLGWIARTDRFKWLPWTKLSAIETDKSIKEEDLSNIIIESLKHYQTQVVFDCSEEKVAELVDKVKKVLAVETKYSRSLNLISGIQIFLVSSINLLVLGILEWERESGQIAIEADEFVFIATYLAGAIDNITYLAGALKDFDEAKAEIQKGVKYLNTSTNDTGTFVIKNPINTIKITFFSGDILIINAWKNPIKDRYEGSVTAFAGPSGCGKSNIVNKLCKFTEREYDAGITIEIFEDGIADPKSVDDITLESLWQHIILVPQESQVYDGSLKDNLKLAIPKETGLTDVSVRPTTPFQIKPDPACL